MINTTANKKFAVTGLPALEAQRLRSGPAGKRGRGVFLKAGVTLEKGTHVMLYGGIERKTDPDNHFTFKIHSRLFLDASKPTDCTAAGDSYLCCPFLT